MWDNTGSGVECGAPAAFTVNCPAANEPCTLTAHFWKSVEERTGEFLGH